MKRSKESDPDALLTRSLKILLDLIRGFLFVFYLSVF